MYAPIDAEALQVSNVWTDGFFGVEQQSRVGAAEFLGIAEEILRHPGASLWVTPEGRFADVRDTSARLMPGLAHLARKIAARRAESLPADGGAQNGDFRSRCVWFIPVAVEYTFWEERQPELLMWFGRPLSDSAMQGEAKSQWDRELSERLRAAQRELASRGSAMCPSSIFCSAVAVVLSLFTTGGASYWGSCVAGRPGRAWSKAQ
ncbi:MAG: hypothetical protein R3C56_20210 [Pirellulaceae bacterium]